MSTEGQQARPQGSLPQGAKGSAEDRITPRKVVPLGLYAGLTLPNRRVLAVTLRDISRVGACVARQGRVEIEEGDLVSLDLRNANGGERMSLQAEVRWQHYSGFNTYLGLYFRGHYVPGGTFLDAYFLEPEPDPDSA